MKWVWAGKVANMDEDRWTKRVTTWRDSAWQADHGKDTERPLRDSPGNRSRWEDEIRKYTGQHDLGNWILAAQNHALWHSHTEQFINFMWR